jgi:hypothetical protein
MKEIILMKLLTKELEKKLPKLYSTDDGTNEKKIVIHYFSPYSNWDWYVFEGERQENGDVLFFGMVQGFEKELGYFTLNELESATKMNGRLKLVERDLYFGKDRKYDIKNQKVI